MSLTHEGKRYRVHQVLGGEPVELIEEIVKRTKISKLLVNLRAEGDAKILQSFVHEALAEQNKVTVTFTQEAAFQPGKPEPTHRIA